MAEWVKASKDVTQRSQRKRTENAEKTTQEIVKTRTLKYAECGARRKVLAAHGEPLGQWFRQTGRAHALLHLFDVVRHAPKFHRVVGGVRDSETCAGISIARLANRARIQ